MKSPVTTKILEIIRTYAYRKEISLSEFGRRAGVSKAWLSKLQNTDANLSVETADRLLSAAGYKLSVEKKSAKASLENNQVKTGNRIFAKMLDEE